MKHLVCFVITLLIGVFLIRPTPILAKSFTFPGVEVEIQLNSDRSANFVERRTFSFSGDFSQVYWEIPLSTEQQMTDIQVLEENNEGKKTIYQETPYPDTNRPEHQFAVVSQGKTIRIEAYHSSRDEEKMFELRYRVSNAVKKHSQIGEFYWKIIGPEWGAGTDELTAQVKLPSNVGKENINVWAHGPLNGTVEIIDGQTTKLSVTNLPQETFVEIRETFPKDIFLGEATGKLSLEDIKAEEEGFRQETIRKQKQAIGILGAVIFILATWGISWFFAWKKFGREYNVFSPKYVHFPPNDRRPALVAALLTQAARLVSTLFPQRYLI